MISVLFLCFCVIYVLCFSGGIWCWPWFWPWFWKQPFKILTMIFSMRPNYQELNPDPMRVTIDRTFRVDIPIVLDFGYALRVGVCLFSNQASPRIPVDLRTREDLDPEKPHTLLPAVFVIVLVCSRLYRFSFSIKKSLTDRAFNGANPFSSHHTV